MMSIKLHKYIFVILISLFIGLTSWWIFLHFTHQTESGAGHLFGAVYGSLALIGGLYGLGTARGWGFFASYFGRAIIFLSLGLLLQEFGQLAYSYAFSIKEIELPYPSIADVGYFGSIPMYIAGAFCLAKGLVVGGILKKSPSKLVMGVTIPLLVLGLCYWSFLKGYIFQETSFWTAFFDFAYPLGQATYVSFALVVLLSLGNMLGGVMKTPVRLLLFAFILQYAADFNFLYQNLNGTWTLIGYGDYLYLFSYFVMAMSLLSLNHALSKAFTSTDEAR